MTSGSSSLFCGIKLLLLIAIFADTPAVINNVLHQKLTLYVLCPISINILLQIVINATVLVRIILSIIWLFTHNQIYKVYT